MQAVVGAVLAGGAGSRMGEPKATVALGGRPLLDYPLAAVRAAGLEPVVVAKPDSPLPPIRVARWDEPNEPRHPLCGIVAALERAGGRPVVVVGCDMPFISAELVAWLAAIAEPLVMPRAEGRLHPLLARYDPSVIGALRHALGRGDPLHQTVAELGVREIGDEELRPFGDPARLLFNVNEPADLAAAERLLAGP